MLNRVEIHRLGEVQVEAGALGSLDVFGARGAAELKRKVLASGHCERARLGIAVAGRERVHDIFLEPIRDAEGTIAGLSGVLTVLDESP